MDMKVTINSMDANLSEVLEKAQQKNITGSVIGIFDHVINIEIEELSQLITIAKEEVISAPYMMKTTDSKGFDYIKDNLSFEDSVNFHFPSEIRMKGHSFDFRESKKWLKRLPTLNESTKKIKDRLKDLESFLNVHGKPKGILNAYFKIYIQSDVDNQKENIYDQYFMKRLNELSKETTIKNLENFIGLGIGLTPSGDDFLLGFISTIYCYGSKIDLKNEIIQYFRENDFKNKTTKVSYYMLKNVLDGQVNDALFDYLVDEKSDKNTIEKIINIGSTSGTDMIVGICYGLRYLLKVKRGE